MPAGWPPPHSAAQGTAGPSQPLPPGSVDRLCWFSQKLQPRSLPVKIPVHSQTRTCVGHLYKCSHKRNFLIFQVCQFLPGPAGLDSASRSCLPASPRCLPASPVSMVSPVSACVPAVSTVSPMSACIPAVSACVPAVSACVPSLYLHPCSAYLSTHSVYLRPRNARCGQTVQL